jgi:thiol:disulfide interchange protein
MPFGLVFASIVFPLLSVWVGAHLILTHGWLRSVLLLLCLLLSAGLLTRQRWARWSGMLAAVAFLLAGTLTSLIREGVRDYLVFFGSLVALILLLVPATGDGRRGLEPGARPFRRTGRILGWASLVTLLALVAVGATTFRGLRIIRPRPSLDPAIGSSQVPSPPGSAARAWLDYGTGLKRAGETGKPVLVDFYTTWCGVCRAMDRRTLRDADVASKLATLITVKVDCEETEERAGHRGVDLAERFQIEAYPTFVLLDPSGRELDRRTGFMNARQFLEWIERSTGAAAASHVPAGRV